MRVKGDAGARLPAQLCLEKSISANRAGPPRLWSSVSLMVSGDTVREGYRPVYGKIENARRWRFAHRVHPF